MTKDSQVRALLGALLAWGLALIPWSAARAAEGPDALETVQLEGKVGPYRVGMTLVVRDHTRIEGGHYFYASKLTDIPLDGQAEDETVTLQEPGGGAFRLHLVSNDSARGQALTFYNSTGLQGDWALGAKTLPVALAMTSGRFGPLPVHWYEDVTEDADTVYEARVRTFLHAVITGDRAAAARGVSYPLQINADAPGKRPLMIRSRAQLLSNWNRIFTPALIARLKDAVPHEMFVHQGQVMVCDGTLWFDGMGAKVINSTE